MLSIAYLWLEHARLIRVRFGIILLGLLLVHPALAQERVQLFVTNEAGFGRMVISFPDRMDLPPYKLRVENGVMSLTFEQAFRLTLPDIAATIPSYVSVARIDPDNKGIRLGLRNTLTFNSMEAGEKLFVDLLPTNWQGLPPGLPAAVIAELTERARNAAQLAEQKRKAEDARTLHPAVNVRVGRHPTFMRVQFNWNIETQTNFAGEGAVGQLDFEWPVAIDLTPLTSVLPPELKSVRNEVTADGSRVVFEMAEGVTPRFYKTSEQEYVLDIDVAAAPMTEEPVDLAELAAEAPAEALQGQAAVSPEDAGKALATAYPKSVSATLVPYFSTIGSTVRLVFPFEQETPAAVFRRGDTVWMLFDTTVAITAPKDDEVFGQIASGWAINPAGDTQVVRIDLAADRLTTIGSEGQAWVLSLGDILLDPTKPITLARRKDPDGLLQVTADLGRPARVHQLKDPVVGDMLKVVTAYPPARGIVRNQEFVDFSALRSVHGLVLRAINPTLEVSIDAELAVIHDAAGLTLSSLDVVRAFDVSQIGARREGFVDFSGLVEQDDESFAENSARKMVAVARLEGAALDEARLELAHYLLANRFGFEAIGLLRVLESELSVPELQKKVRLARAIANVIAGRTPDALNDLKAETFSDQADALFWRAIAKSAAGDYTGAAADAAAAEAVVDSYPAWMRNRFLLAAARAAIETGNQGSTRRYLSLVQKPSLEPDEASLHQLLSGRLQEASGETVAALETFGQVISADIRPTRAEAVYRTLRILDQGGGMKLGPAADTLSAEAMLWRGTTLEAEMLAFLAELYFREKEYRRGFETVKQAVQFEGDTVPSDALLGKAQQMFAALFLDGEADALDPVEALGLYYDFREMTPPGAQGDEMIRNLARRLVKVDLLEQAADVLNYQVENRLEGAARAQVAADLAVIYIADRHPELALRALSQTRIADLAPSIERQRRILEARALIDVGREDLALDLLGKLTGRDADLLRVDAHWKAKRYRVAAEALELAYGPTGPSANLSQPARMNVIKAAVGFVLGNDRMGLARLRSKFSDAMANSAEWGMFDYVTGNFEGNQGGMAQLAHQIAAGDSLSAFLASYRATYGVEGNVAPEVASPDIAG